MRAELDTTRLHQEVQDYQAWRQRTAKQSALCQALEEGNKQLWLTRSVWLVLLTLFLLVLVCVALGDLAYIVSLLIELL